MKISVLLLFFLSFIFVVNAQHTKDFYEQVASLTADTNPRKNSLVPSPPAELPNIELEAKKNNKNARIGTWNRMETREEFENELTRLREEYKKYLQNFTPEFSSTRVRKYLKDFSHRFQIDEDLNNFSNVLSGYGEWQQVKIPHYGGPVGYKTAFYRTTFDLSDKMAAKKRKVIHFKGVDYEARVYLNGRFIGSHTGFFEAFEFDITSYVKNEGNTLLVEVINHHSVLGLDKDGKRLSGNKLFAAGGIGWDTPGFGWHSCQPGMGISQDIYIEGKSDIAIADIFVRPDIDKKEIELYIGVDNFNLNTYRLPKLSFSIYSKNFKGFAIENIEVDLGHSYAGPGYNRYKVLVPFPNFRLWNTETPWLYSLRVELNCDDDNDIQQTHFGMRKFHQDTVNIPKGRYFLNNKHVILRGANTMGNLQRAVYEKDEQRLIDDILIAKMTNMNFFRLTQRPVQEEIYDMCDRLGIMLQTDLPIFAFLPVEVLEEAVKQAGAMEKLVRNHPSNVVVTFENEPHDPSHFGNGSRSMTRIGKENFYRAAAEIVHIHNPDRVIKPIDGDYDPPTPFGMPDYHMYAGWYGSHGVPLGKLNKGYWMKNKKDWMSGCGEHGSEGLEAMETMFKYYPEQWLPEKKSANAKWHPKKMSIASVIEKKDYMRDEPQQTSRMHGMWFDEQETIGEWIEASQEHQAFVTRMVTRSFRRQSDRIASNAIHLLIDAWPSGWQKSLIDVQRIPKKAWFEYRDALSPLLTDIRTDRNRYFGGEKLAMEFWLANDKEADFKTGELVWEVRIKDKIVFANKKEVDIPSVRPEFIGHFRYQLPKVKKRTTANIRIALQHGGEVIHSTNISVDIFPEIKQKTQSIIVIKNDDRAFKLAEQLNLSPVYLSEYNSKKSPPVLLSNHKSISNKKVQTLLELGANVLLMEQTKDSVFTISNTKIKISPHEEGVDFISQKTGHPLVAEYKPFDFSYMYNSNAGYITNAMYSYFEPNFELKTVLKVLNDKPVLAELQIGKGKVYITQLQLENFIENEPALRKLILDILE